jgi:CheY-like chemotaxis protein
MSNKLLLADDSITIRKVVGIIFANEDFSLTVVDNGNAAAEKAREIVPDIILADVVMPGKNGYEVCEEIRREPELKHIPLLLLTGAFEPFDEDKARSCGADDFISKPFESQQLLEKVRRLVETGKERKAAQAIPVVMPEPEIEVLQPATPPPSSEAFFGETAGTFVPPEEGMEETVFLMEEISATEEIVEALPEDDLWGAFDMEELAEETPVEPETVLEKDIKDPFAELENMDFQSLGEEKTAFAPEPAPEPVVSPAEAIAPSWQPAAEETFTLGEEAEVGGLEPEQEEDIFSFAPEEEPLLSEPATDDVFVLGDDTEEQLLDRTLALPPIEAGQTSPEFELQFAPEEEYVPVLSAASPSEPSLSAAVDTAQPVPAGEQALSEEQLAAMIAKVSRDIIEKIAWEVVPDLAESLIREEIRKIKKGIQD